jgi:protein-glutamine gamma-glutamyltransferase
VKAIEQPIPLHTVGWTVAALLVAALPHLAAMPGSLAALVVTAAAWRLAAAHYGWKAPPRWLRLTLTLGVVALVIVTLGASWGRRTAATLLCVMLATKMLELFRIRDLRMVASVCFFLIATQFLFSERLFYLVYLAAGALVAVVALIQVQRHEDSILTGSSAKPPDHRRLIRQGAVMVVATLPVALTLFVLFPRLAQPLWGLPEQVMDGRTGLSDSMSPGSIANLFLDDSPAFRAEFDDQPPLPQDRYWRGPVLWHFDGNTWRQSQSASRQPASPVNADPASIRYSIQLEPHEQRWLFVLDYPVHAPSDSHVSLDYQVINRRPVTSLMQYEMISNPNFVDMPVLHESLRRQALSLPPERNPRTLGWAHELRERHPDDRDLIMAVLRWFNEEEFFYSLKTTPTGRHGADEFLFDLRVGYCEHYASAFAILMRAAGIPSRVVTGYQGGFWQPNGRYLLIRQSDAHAWTEVWLEGSGWTRVDPTSAVAPDRIEQGSRSAIGESHHLLDTDLLRALRNRYDRLQHLWNRWILGFDAERQRQLLERLGMPDTRPSAIALIMVTALAIVIAALTLVLLGRSWLETDPLVRAWYRLERRLQQVGVTRASGETPLELLERAADSLPDHAFELQQLAELFARARYGPQQTEQAKWFIEHSKRFSPGRPGEPTSLSGV